MALVVAVFWVACLTWLDWKLRSASVFRDAMSGVLFAAAALSLPQSWMQRLGLARRRRLWSLWPPLLCAVAIFCGLAAGRLAYRISRDLRPPVEARRRADMSTGEAIRCVILSMKPTRSRGRGLFWTCPGAEQGKIPTSGGRLAEPMPGQTSRDVPA